MPKEDYCYANYNYGISTCGEVHLPESETKSSI